MKTKSLRVKDNVVKDKSFIDVMTIGHVAFGVITALFYFFINVAIIPSMTPEILFLVSVPVAILVFGGWELIEVLVMKPLYEKMEKIKHWEESSMNSLSDLLFDTVSFYIMLSILAYFGL